MNKIGNKRCKIFHIFRLCGKMLMNQNDSYSGEQEGK